MRIDIDHLALPEPESVSLLKAEVRRLRCAITALSDQDATLSVCNGTVTVTMDATLTDEERLLITSFADQWEEHAALWRDKDNGVADGSERNAATLRGLLERLRNNPAKPDSSTLTDAERAAVERVAGLCAGWAALAKRNELAGQDADTLRGLLERL